MRVLVSSYFSPGIPPALAGGATQLALQQRSLRLVRSPRPPQLTPALMKSRLSDDREMLKMGISERQYYTHQVMRELYEKSQGHFVINSALKVLRLRQSRIAPILTILVE